MYQREQARENLTKQLIKNVDSDFQAVREIEDYIEDSYRQSNTEQLR